jgi:hypothetical protein
VRVFTAVTAPPFLVGFDVTYSFDFPGAGLMLEATVGGIVSILANVIYIDRKRKGLPGFSRICAFWMGTPLTWLWFFIISEGKRPVIAPPKDDMDELLAEIRRAKALRGSGGEGERALPEGDQSRTSAPTHPSTEGQPSGEKAGPRGQWRRLSY